MSSNNIKIQIDSLINDTSIREIRIHDSKIWINKRGQNSLVDISYSDEELALWIDETLELHNKVKTEVIYDFRYFNGDRIVILFPPISNGVTVHINKWYSDSYTLDDLISMNTLTEHESEYLKNAVKEGKNILISGGTGSGKTTLLNGLAEYIPSEETLTVLEDSTELKIVREHVVRTELFKFSPSEQGKIIDFIFSRPLPHRVILGELRNQIAYELLKGIANTKKKIMTTVHGQSSYQALERYFSFVYNHPEFQHSSDYEIKQMMANNLNIIVQINRLNDGKRVVTELVEITGYDKEKDEFALKGV